MMAPTLHAVGVWTAEIGGVLVLHKAHTLMIMGALSMAQGDNTAHESHSASD